MGKKGDKHTNKQEINIKNSKDIQIGDISINSGIELDTSPKKDASSKLKNAKMKIQELISDGETEKALFALKEQHESDPPKYDQVILLLSRYNRLMKQSMMSTVEPESIDKELNKINLAILEMSRK